MSRVIRVAGVSKRYMLRHLQRPRYDSLREAMTSGFKRVVKRALGASTSSSRQGFDEEFWALQDVSFEVKEGERLGIVGRNGAGKSTLLKLLSRISEPTKGRIEICGRVTSLLEVGTGFHPELTGRENIFLNGAILGMSAREIRRKFDGIVAFAEIERFLDTPVKRYSSGMYVRLAFSVAAHLEPEILIIDEVLAVGDAGFQQKCIGRMEEAANSGRTILFVSHAMPAIRKLCNRVIYLDAGRVRADGPADDVTRRYLAEILPKESDATAERHFPDDAAKPAVIRRVATVDERGRPCRNFGLDSAIALELDYELKRDARDCMVLFAVGRDGTYIYQSHDTDLDEEKLLHRRAGCYRARVALPRRLLTAGRYSIYAVIAIGPSGEYGHDGRPDAITFTISEDDQVGLIDRKGHGEARGTLVIAELSWQTTVLNPSAWSRTQEEAGVRP